MAPMRNSQYFQPMQHKPLPDIRKYSLLNDKHEGFMAVAKPKGIDVFIRNGQIFDFNQKELKNQYLKFHFEKLLQTSVNMKMNIVGVLVDTSNDWMLANRLSLYQEKRTVFGSLKFLVYDIMFPLFNVDHTYRWRYDIALKTVGELANCDTLLIKSVKDEYELRNFVRDTFEDNVNKDIIVYNSEGKFVPGDSQLYWENEDVESYIINASQRYRGHIKRVVSTTEQLPDGTKFEVALFIVARFKKEYINVPINNNNMALRKYIWDHRKDLKAFPFWFTGYTYLDTLANGVVDYVTVVNEFHSFIPTSDACVSY